ncbi:MAG: hypothetical protein KF862_05470 [Chitinophagaceae bacterium]|nr:hypothetical protein [Chitinophagaceae bacterium]
MATIIPPKPEYNRFEIPDSFRKGQDFEDFVIAHLFPNELYTLIRRSADYHQNKQDFQESSLYPDFTLRDNATGIEFFVECKYRYSLIANSFRFSKSYQIERYKTYNDRPFFLVLGLGGSAAAPAEIFLANFKDCPYVHLFKRHLRNKSIPVNKPVLSAELWKHEFPLRFPEKKIA